MAWATVPNLSSKTPPTDNIMSKSELKFTKDDPSKTQIYLASNTSEIVYDVVSFDEDQKFQRTGNRYYTVVVKDGEEIARLEWHDTSQDVVVWSNNLLPPTKMNEWMNPSSMPFVKSAHLVETQR